MVVEPDRDRFDLDLIDPANPFEIDRGNRPHLAKHPPFTHEDALDAWHFGDPRFYPADLSAGPADWLMVAELAGEGLVLVQLAPARHAGPRRCRPIEYLPPGRGSGRPLPGEGEAMTDADDARAFATYDDAANREPVPGPSRRRATRSATLSEYVPIRLSADAMEAVRQRAHAENLTVSAWVRRLIERALTSGIEDDPAAAVTQAIETLEGVRRSLEDIPASGGVSRSGTRAGARVKRTD